MIRKFNFQFIRHLRQLGELLRLQNVPALLWKLKNDGFLKNVAVLASGTVVSQVIVMATLPVLTRLYSPTEYGTYSMYLSIIGILLMVISFSYENAITLPEDDRTASNVLSLSLRICIGVSIASGIGIHILEEPLSAWLHESYLTHYYLFFIVSLFGAGFYQILNYWSIRKKYFKQLARTKYTQSLSQVSSQIGLSLFHLGPLGLIIGDIIGRFGGLLPQWKLWRRDVKSQAITSDWADLKESAYRYRRFPFLSMAAGLLNSVVLYVPTILLASFYGPQVAGWFALCQRILGSPMTLIMTSVRNVYLAESADSMINHPHKLYPLFRKTVRNVFLFGALVIFIIVGVGPYLFSFLFGEEWARSGSFIRILSMMYLSQFVANSVGSTIDVMERQDLHLYREIIRTVLILGSLYFAWHTHQSAEMAIGLFSAASTLGYALHLGLSWHSVRKYRGAEDKAEDTLETVEIIAAEAAADRSLLGKERG
ncbi:oligosaccharide flippase family protein [Paenibacillus phoenicis]|uniref:Oligosaccharide flippase family protein n=1 Tax=Paenibacillus phoenicis TaxID=554117 RepID=A0ABU5PQJ5_9BACL|nr:MULTISPECIES: oligosaccharide flippase family protein [Paenibacillus]MCT2194957.1 oligosaccharide flippase family protein [Paenibacillus sp. p3-SID1389]MEA3572233.1 oligosaccharide flippase family protein [Paenibacillus phoenicis]